MPVKREADADFDADLDAATVRRTSVLTIALLMGVYVIDYIDRVMIAVALPFLGADLDLDKTQQGLVVSAFAIAYMVFQVPGGLLADRFGARPLLVVSLVAWSVFTAATGLVGGLVALLAVRCLFGVAQALFPGASFKALAERTTPRTRNRSAGLMLASNFLGAGLAPLIVAPIIVAIGWRHSFWVVALGGVVLGLLMWRLLPRPLPREATELDAAADPAPAAQAGAARVLRSPLVWRYALLFACFNMLNYGMITWVPSYLLETRGLSLVAAGLSSAVPMLITAASAVVGGWLMSRWFDDRARLLVVPVLAVSAVLLVLMLQAETTLGFTVYQSLAMAFSGLASMGILGMPIRALPRELIGSGMGLVNTGGQMAGVLAPLVMGWLADRFDFAAAFGFLVATTVAAALIALVTSSRPADLQLGAPTAEVSR
ncbi:MFS transporter [Pseudonocardia zijingensis]|uniref:MFS transporter n=1 Tax=Pseudonocardia zijingensis TaxID=153376 RepID=A0ABN1N7X2_9PSEU